MRAARWWPGVLVAMALSVAFVAAFPTSPTGRHEPARIAVGATTIVTSSDDVTDDVGASPLLELGVVLAALLVLVRPREASWRVHPVDAGDSTRPFERGDEPCRAPPPAAIA